MIAFVEMTVTFAALTALCLFLNTKMRLAAGLTPLFVLCGTMVWYSTLGSVHMLVPAGIVWFGAAAAACVWLWRKHKDIRWREFFFARHGIFPAGVAGRYRAVCRAPAYF